MLLRSVGTVMMAAGLALAAIDLTGAGNRLLGIMLCLPHEYLPDHGPMWTWQVYAAMIAAGAYFRHSPLRYKRNN